MKREIMTGKPTHPGTVLLEDIMKPLNLSVTETARLLGVSRKALSDLINEKSSLSPEMAIRIAKATNTSPESWMNMQQKLTLWTAYQNEQKNVKLFPLTTI
ncbi:MAG: HigA family addiction module antidote protein [Solobacterium sp.]|nr:HigA family addiction module antidote protein [Solobacterium sp.]